MPRLKNAVPKYRKHKQSGQAIVTLIGRDFLLGPWDTNTSRAKYDRLISEWLNSDRQPLVQSRVGLLVAEMVTRYWTHTSKKYTRCGKPAAELFKLKTAVRHLLRHYENQLAWRCRSGIMAGHVQRRPDCTASGTKGISKGISEAPATNEETTIIFS